MLVQELQQASRSCTLDEFGDAAYAANEWSQPADEVLHQRDERTPALEKQQPQLRALSKARSRDGRRAESPPQRQELGMGENVMGDGLQAALLPLLFFCPLHLLPARSLPPLLARCLFLCLWH
eukprot:4651158-Pleurochrysis_carterae.AAC.1